MARKSQVTPESARARANEQWEGMAAFNNEAAEILTTACLAYANGVATMNGELLGFVRTRLNHDVELSRALSQCANWSDAVNLQQDWARQATEEYLAEAGKLTELASKVAKENWEPVYERANQMMMEINKTAD